MSAPAVADTPPLYSLDLLAPHQTYRLMDGTRVPGVTTILGRTLPKDGLLHWAWTCGVEGVDYKQARDHAANIGTVAHARIEARLRGMAFNEASVTPDLMAGSDAAVERFFAWWDEQGYRPHLLEHQMVSEAWRCGGTLDIVGCKNKSHYDLVDIKTTNNNKSWPYDDTIIQVSAYAAMYEQIHRGGRRGRPRSSAILRDIHIVRIGKQEGDPGTVYTLSPEERAVGAATFLGLLETYDRLGDLRRARSR